jgi:U3 small nucleolar RNA-associated protein MPP10
MSNSQEIPEELPLPPVLSDLSNLLDHRLESFASGNEEIQLAALTATKYIFDHGSSHHSFPTDDLLYLFILLSIALTTESRSRPHIVDLLSSLNPAEAPQTRSQANSAGKRKRSPPLLPQFNETPLSSLCIDSVDSEQVWAQLELRAEGICDMLQKALDGTDSPLGEQDDVENGEESKSRKKLRFSDLTPEDLEQLGMDAETLEKLAQEDEDDEDEDDSSDDSASDEEDDDGDDADLGEEIAELKDPDEDEPPQQPLFVPPKKRKAHQSSGGANSELDDGFFNLVSFNAETEEGEAKHVSRGRLGKNLEDEDSESEVESVDYFALVEDDQEATGSSE